MVDGKRLANRTSRLSRRATSTSAGRLWTCITSGAHTRTATSWRFSPRSACWLPGDTYANDPGTPELVDFDGGGSAIEWPETLT